DLSWLLLSALVVVAGCGPALEGTNEDSGEDDAITASNFGRKPGFLITSYDVKREGQYLPTTNFGSALGYSFAAAFLKQTRLQGTGKPRKEVFTSHGYLHYNAAALSYS